MELGLKGKVAWVLGASSGIGYATARSLAYEGASVALSARGEETLERAASEIAAETGTRCIAVPLDVRDPGAIEQAARRVAAELGPVRILVSNAAGPPAGRFDDLGDAELAAAFELTLASAWRLTKSVLAGMRTAGGGCLIYITSWSTKEVIQGLLLSNTMRAAVVGMSKTLSKELAADGIRALCVAPGRIDTPRLRELDDRNAQATGRSLEEVQQASRGAIPLGRYGEPAEIGDVIAFLASERASFVNGVTVLVDGGMLSGVLS